MDDSPKPPDPHPTDDADSGLSPEVGASAAELEARARELDLIQSLGRAAAEATTVDQLFDVTLGVLNREGQADLLVVTHRADAVPEMRFFPARPLGGAFLKEIRRRGRGLLGCTDPDRVRERWVELEFHDAARGMREAFREEHLLVVPLLRRDVPVAYLMAVPAAGVDEARLRPLYSAANHLALHLDRILEAREAGARQLRSILESMPQAVVMTDDRLRIVQRNRSASELLDRLGLAASPNGEALVRRLGLANAVEAMRRAPCPIVQEVVTVEGELILDVTVTPLMERPGAGSGWVMVLSDVTESRRLQRRVAHTEKMSSLGQMISGVAHELNNPLATILGYTQLMQSTSKDPALRKRMQLLNEEAQRCRKIVENLLSFARRREPESKPVSLNEVVQSVVALMKYQLRVANVTLETETDPDLPPVQGDRHQLQQVLVNLVTNARQAIEGEGVAGTITLTTAPAGEGAALTVADSGPGVPEEIRSRIFDPFFTTKIEGKGTGLGLSLVYGIVESHGGQIELLPATGAGAAFRLSFPPSRARQEAETRDPSAATTRAVVPARILVVDDEAAFAGVVCEAMAEDGHHVEMASDGHAALARIEQQEFDLIISDLRMPGMGGERLHRALEAEHPHLAGRLLLTTGDTVGEEVESLAARTGLEILHKPFELDELRSRVRSRLDPREAG